MSLPVFDVRADAADELRVAMLHLGHVWSFGAGLGIDLSQEAHASVIEQPRHDRGPLDQPDLGEGRAREGVAGVEVGIMVVIALGMVGGVMGPRRVLWGGVFEARVGCLGWDLGFL